jgi:hypothetical protein
LNLKENSETFFFYLILNKKSKRSKQYSIISDLFFRAGSGQLQELGDWIEKEFAEACSLYIPSLLSMRELLGGGAKYTGHCKNTVTYSVKIKSLNSST